MREIIERAEKNFGKGVLQEELRAWQRKNFGYTPMSSFVLGAVEELGELFEVLMTRHLNLRTKYFALNAFIRASKLCHYALKRSQFIRGMNDEQVYKEKAGDAIADCVVFLIQTCTSLKLDFKTLVEGVAEEVMKRDWKP